MKSTLLQRTGKFAEQQPSQLDSKRQTQHQMVEWDELRAQKPIHHNTKRKAFYQRIRRAKEL
jgi:hypothetical protein